MERPAKRQRLYNLEEDELSHNYQQPIQLETFTGELEEEVQEEGYNDEDGEGNEEEDEEEEDGNCDPDDELQQRRAQLDYKLKSRFEAIFEKYGQDFEGVGDEVDLLTGEILVDNGHLIQMRDEQDAGISSGAHGGIMSDEEEGFTSSEEEDVDEIESRGEEEDDDEEEDIAEHTVGASQEDNYEMEATEDGRQQEDILSDGDMLEDDMILRGFTQASQFIHKATSAEDNPEPYKEPLPEVRQHPTHQSIHHTTVLPSSSAILAQFGPQLGAQIVNYVKDQGALDDDSVEPAWRAPYIASMKPSKLRKLVPKFRFPEQERSPSPDNATSIWAAGPGESGNGNTGKGRRRRITYTPQDDIALLDFVAISQRKGLNLSSVTTWAAFADKHPSHEWKAWKRRYLTKHASRFSESEHQADIQSMNQNVSAHKLKKYRIPSLEIEKGAEHDNFVAVGAPNNCSTGLGIQHVLDISHHTTSSTGLDQEPIAPVSPSRHKELQRSTRIRNPAQKDPSMITWTEAVASIESLDPSLHSSLLRDIKKANTGAASRFKNAAQSPADTKQVSHSELASGGFRGRFGPAVSKEVILADCPPDADGLEISDITHSSYRKTNQLPDVIPNSQSSSLGLNSFTSPLGHNNETVRKYTNTMTVPNSQSSSAEMEYSLGDPNFQISHRSTVSPALPTPTSIVEPLTIPGSSQSVPSDQTQLGNILSGHAKRVHGAQARNTVDASYNFSDEEEVRPVIRYPTRRSRGVPPAKNSLYFIETPDTVPPKNAAIPLSTKPFRTISSNAKNVPQPQSSTKSNLVTAEIHSVGSAIEYQATPTAGKPKKSPLSQDNRAIHSKTSLVTPLNSSSKLQKSMLHSLADTDDVDELSLGPDGFLFISSQPRNAFRSGLRTLSHVKREDSGAQQTSAPPTRKRKFNIFAGLDQTNHADEIDELATDVCAIPRRPKETSRPVTQVKKETPDNLNLGSTTSLPNSIGVAQQTIQEAIHTVESSSLSRITHSNPPVYSPDLGMVESIYSEHRLPAVSGDICDTKETHRESQDKHLVPVHDSCDIIRAKIREHLQIPSIKQTDFLRDIAEVLPGGREIQIPSLTSFMLQDGASKGRKSIVYYAAYIFFEKMRLKDNKPKSRHRLEMEVLYPSGLYLKSARGPSLTENPKKESPAVFDMNFAPQSKAHAQREICEESDAPDSSSPLANLLTPSHKRRWDLLKQEGHDGVFKTPGGTIRTCGVDGASCGRSFCFRCSSSVTGL